MDPDLVGAPGRELEAQPRREPAERLLQPIAGQRPLAARDHRHALAVPRVAADRRLDRAGRARRHAPDDRLVDPLDAVHAELRGEADMGAVVLGDHHQAARRPCRGGARCPAAARRRCPRARRRRRPAMAEQRVDQRAAGDGRAPGGPRARRACRAPADASSSYSTSSAIASGCGRAATGSGTRSAKRSPGLTRLDPSVIRAPSRVTAPASSSACRRARDISGSRAARNLSTRSPASAAAAVTVRVGVGRIIGGQGGQHPAPAQGLCDRRRRRAGRRQRAAGGAPGAARDRRRVARPAGRTPRSACRRAAASSR